MLPASIFTNSGGENAVFNLDRALEEIPIEQEQRKKIINEWKSKIFDNISLDYIDESYDAVALGIAKAIGFHNE